MKCVWVQGWQGAARMDDGVGEDPHRPAPGRLQHQGQAAWLRVVRMTKKIGEFAPKPVKVPAAKPAAPKPDVPKTEKAA